MRVKAPGTLAFTADGGGPSNDLGGLYKTTDRGQNWEQIFDSHRVTSATVSSINPDELYVTTELDGLMFTENLNDATPTFTRVDEVTFRQAQQVIFNPYNDNEVWVTSFGGQLWKGTIDSGDQIGGQVELSGNKLVIDQVADGQVITVRQTASQYRFILSNDVWGGLAISGVSGIGTSTLSVNRSMLNGLAQGLSMRDSGNTDYDVVFAGQNDFTDLVGWLELDSVGDITQSGAGGVSVDRARFEGMDILLNSPSNALSMVEVNGEDVDLQSQSRIWLTGSNTATNLSLQSENQIGNYSGATIDVVQNLTVQSGSRIDLARREKPSV